MNKIYKSLLSCFGMALVVILLPLSLKAQTMDDLKNQFTALGGSESGFSKIIEVVQKSQEASSKLKSKIDQTYNKQLFDIMVAQNFDSKAYTQSYNQIEKDKSQLVKQNLQDMISLLQSLSPKDRQAYAQLLYGVNKAVPNVENNNNNNNQKNNNVANTANTQNNNNNNNNKNKNNVANTANTQNNNNNNNNKNKNNKNDISNTNTNANISNTNDTTSGQQQKAMNNSSVETVAPASKDATEVNNGNQLINNSQ